LVYWRGGDLYFHNFAKRLTVATIPFTCEVLDFFGRWRTLQQTCARFSEYEPSSVFSSVVQLLKSGLLVGYNTEASREDDLISKRWSAWLPAGSFHFSTKDVPYLAGDLSARRLRQLMPKQPPPAVFKNVKGSKKSLPKRIFPDCEFVNVLLARKTHRQFSNGNLKLETLSQLLSLVWGITSEARSSVFGQLLYKTSPSGGARHPGEVYVMALRVHGLKPGIYHYHPQGHHLTRLDSLITADKAYLYCAGQPHARDAAALFLMTAVFGRTMWKYRNARAYRVVLLDAGHLCQTFCLVSTWLGLAPFCTAAIKDTLIEKDLGIDGVSESILYVAGVGLAVTSGRATRRFSRSADRPGGNPSRAEVSAAHN